MIRPVLVGAVQDGGALSDNHRLPPFPGGKEFFAVLGTKYSLPASNSNHSLKRAGSEQSSKKDYKDLALRLKTILVTKHCRGVKFYTLAMVQDGFCKGVDNNVIPLGFFFL